MALLKRKEGLNLFYKLAGLAALMYMKRYPSIDKRTSFGVERSIGYFKGRLNEMSQNPLYLGGEKLEKLKFLKEKYYIYGTYLAATSTFPILYSFGSSDCIRSIFAKTAAVASAKMLDNINDRWHSIDDAITSLEIYDRALSKGDFELNDCYRNETLRKAENSAFTIAHWAYQILSCHAMDTHFFEVYKQDVHTFVNGQVDSLKQRIDYTHEININLTSYLNNVVEKSWGKIWFDYDICFYEGDAGELDQGGRKAVEHLRRGVDYIFKSCLMYDDISDLREDINQGIINSVILLGIEDGTYSEDDFKKAKMLKKIEKNEVMENASQMADLFFVRGVEEIEKGKSCTERMDTNALIFNARLLRIFALRKWAFKMNTEGMSACLRSFDTIERLKARISDRILELEKAIS